MVRNNHRRQSGWISKWDVGRGFGAIGVKNHYEDYYVHLSEIKGNGGQPLWKGVKVDFDTGYDRNGRIIAVNVSIIQNQSQFSRPSYQTMRQSPQRISSHSTHRFNRF